jgi:hypothetical protein
MLRKIIAMSILSLSLFAAKAARAESWYMVSEYDFDSFTKTTDYEHAGGRGGYINSGTPQVRTVLRIPVGATITSLYCQVLDASPTKDIVVSLDEFGTPDDASGFRSRNIFTVTSSGAPGHVKISTFGAGSIVKDFECLSSACMYYTYVLTASLLDTSNTNIKSCAISYQ